jgi:hypothetical protein
LPNELPKALEALEPHRAELVGVVVESTYNWYWLVDGLQAAGYTLGATARRTGSTHARRRSVLSMFSSRFATGSPPR